MGALCTLFCYHVPEHSVLRLQCWTQVRTQDAVKPSVCSCSRAPLAPPLAMMADASCSAAAHIAQPGSSAAPAAFQQDKMEQGCQQQPSTAQGPGCGAPAKAGVQKQPSSWHYLLSSSTAVISNSRMKVGL